MPRSFGPRGVLRPPRTVRYKWPILLVVTSLPIAAIVAAASATSSGFLGLLIYPILLVFCTFFSAWTSTGRDGFAAGFLAGWTGYFFGTIVGVPIQVALNPDSGLLEVLAAPFLAVIVGAIFGLFFGLIGGAGGWLAAKVKLRLRPPTNAPRRIA